MADSAVSSLRMKCTPEHPEIFVEAFERLKEQGKIRHYAISTNDLASLKALNANGGCASCQMEYSILRRGPEKDLLPYCLENNIGVLLRGPLTKVFPDANHLFQAAGTGSPNEYAELEPEFLPGFLDTISAWILEQVK